MLPAADTAACSPAVWGWPWVRPLSILRLDIADRAVIRVAGESLVIMCSLLYFPKPFSKMHCDDDNLIVTPLLMMLTCQQSPSHLPGPLTVTGCVQSSEPGIHCSVCIHPVTIEQQQLSSPRMIIAVVTSPHTCLHVSCLLPLPRPALSTVTPSSTSISGLVSWPRSPSVTSSAHWRAIRTYVD